MTTGDWVIYKPTGEKGRVKSRNDSFIFVVFKCNNEWDRFHAYTGCACREIDLELLETADERTS
jgi:hypothetical protein